MTVWIELPPEARHLLNPAFCGHVLATTVDAYGAPFPFPLVFLTLPLVLHRRTREALPRSIRTPFPTWLERNAEVRVGLAERARELVPFARTAVVFQLSANTLQIREDGTLVIGSGWSTARRTPASGSEEVEACVRSAALVGRWFSRAGDPATIYTLCGVRP